MNPTDDLSSYYAELLEGTCDCVERVVLNDYFPMGPTGSGLRTWWRQLHGSDASLDDARLRKMAGALSRRLSACCAKQQVPLIEAQAGERKHELAEPHLPKGPKFGGLFLVITGKAPAPVWQVIDPTRGLLDLEQLKTLLGFRHRPHFTAKRGAVVIFQQKHGSKSCWWFS